MYYGKHIKHRLIDPNQIRFNGIYLFENPICDDDLYTEMDDELNAPVQFKGTKCILSSRVPTHDELETWRHFDMKSHNEWNPYSINIRDLTRIYQLSKKDMRYIYQTKRDTVYTYPIPTSNHVHDTYLYHDPSYDEAISLEISSSFIQVKELYI